MARPVDEKRRTEIATAALAVLRDRGVQGTRMSHIADALGMKRPTLYWYFGSLADLFEFAMKGLRDEEARYVGERLAGAGHPIDALFACVRGSYDYYRERGIEDFVFLLCQGWVAGDSEQRNRFTRSAMRFMDPTRQLLVGLIEAGVAAEQVKPCDASDVVDFALATLNGAIVMEVLTGAPADSTFAYLFDNVLAPLRV